MVTAPVGDFTFGISLYPMCSAMEHTGFSGMAGQGLTRM
jgi:hypothetical protein